MGDIMDVLQAVYQGLDHLQVVGMENAKTLVACGDGLAAAMRALGALLTAEASPAGKKPENTEEAVTDG